MPVLCYSLPVPNVYLESSPLYLKTPKTMSYTNRNIPSVQNLLKSNTWNKILAAEKPTLSSEESRWFDPIHSGPISGRFSLSLVFVWHTELLIPHPISFSPFHSVPLSTNPSPPYFQRYPQDSSDCSTWLFAHSKMKFREKKIEEMKSIPQTEMTPLEELLAMYTAVTATNWTLCCRANEQNNQAV